MNPNEAAYWVEDDKGNLIVYNGSGQYLDVVPKAAAGDFVARFNQGQRDMTKDYRLGADASSGGSANGPAWANVNLRGQELAQSHQQFGATLAEQQRQFNETMGKDKSMFDQNLAFQTAQQKWREAVDARDFSAAEYWKARSQELQQNHLALDYTQLLSSKSGPQDWIQYARLSRGESPLGTPDGRTVPLDQALPEWARGFRPGSYPDSRGQTATASFGGQPGAGGPAAGAQGSAGPRGVIDMVHSTMDNPARTSPAWAQGASQPLDKPMGYGGGMMPKGAVLGAGEGGVPISMSDWAVKAFGNKGMQ